MDVKYIKEDARVKECGDTLLHYYIWKEKLTGNKTGIIFNQEEQRERLHEGIKRVQEQLKRDIPKVDQGELGYGLFD